MIFEIHLNLMNGVGLNLIAKQARAKINIAPASYKRVIASISLPCKIINLAKAVIAMNSGSVIGIFLLL